MLLVASCSVLASLIWFMFFKKPDCQMQQLKGNALFCTNNSCSTPSHVFIQQSNVNNIGLYSLEDFQIVIGRGAG
ncbi:unnamed protein product [Trifolium pratense]|uniref:Uncharacterized protein n=1 Tax=Trifolium pratense TaxID=57577 RepID=A0ACB0LTV9_TRIPR|nr:unnamed protein product [Trifolium pratense]